MHEVYFFIFYCTQPPHVEVTKLLCPHHEGAGAPYPIRAGGADLWYQMVLVDTTVEQSLISSAGGDERVCEMCGYQARWGGGGQGGWLCCPIGHVPPGGSTEGACQVLRPARQQGGSSSVAILVVVKWIVCAAAAAPTATPASVRIDSRCPAPPVDYRAG
jgi:hypothetical protein